MRCKRAAPPGPNAEASLGLLPCQAMMDSSRRRRRLMGPTARVASMAANTASQARTPRGIDWCAPKQHALDRRERLKRRSFFLLRPRTLPLGLHPNRSRTWTPQRLGKPGSLLAIPRWYLQRRCANASACDVQPLRPEEFASAMTASWCRRPWRRLVLASVRLKMFLCPTGGAHGRDTHIRHHCRYRRFTYHQ